MPTMAEVRAQYPQYNDLSDEQLAQGLHSKFYSDMPYDEFAKKVGLSKPPEQRMETDAEVNARVQSKYGNMGFGDKVVGDLKSAVSGVTPIIRGGWDAVSSLPSIAADMGVSARNMLTGSNYELPSKQSERSLDQALPMPNTPGSSVMRFGTALLAGGKLPAPQVNNPAPAGFVKPAQDLVRQQTLAQGQKAGYVVPPSTTNPTAANTFLESFGGKIATAQDAALKNQEVTNTLAKRALGLSEDAPLAQESLAALRKEAGGAYETLRNVGSVALDDTTTKTLDGIASKFTGSKLKEALGGGNDIPKIVQAIKDEKLTGETAVDAIALLRDKASTSYMQGSKEVGKAYKTLAGALEDLMEKNLSGDALKQFRDARQLIAKTYSVESAFNPSSGNVVATKLAAQLGKGKPLSGDLLTAARFGQAFPKAAKEVVDSGSVRNTDAILGSGAAVFSGHPWYLGWPFLRQGVRSFLLSDPGQKMAVASQPNGIPPEVAMSMISGANSLRQK